jgi:ATP-binding cassette subfamily B protein
MTFEPSARIRRRWLAPEVVQTSAMDCGPASLTSLLAGFGVNVSYGRLREACRTDVDGTSIDTIEEIAGALGLDAEQIMVPVDHVLAAAAQALPAIVVVRLPDGSLHFVVAWRRHGPFIQVIDPATGRRWMPTRRFLNELYVHTFSVAATDWREWAGSAEFLDVLRQRISRLGLSQATVSALIDSATSDPDWVSLAALDAATRMLTLVVCSGSIPRGNTAQRALEHLVTQARRTALDDDSPIPAHYWSVRLAPPDADGEERLLLRGALLVRARGLRAAEQDRLDADLDDAQAQQSPELVAALNERPSRPWRELLRLLCADGGPSLVILLLTLIIIACGMVVEALLFRSLLDIGGLPALTEQRLGALAAIIGFVALLLALDLVVAHSAWQLGRKLETRLRMAFLHKTPRLGDRYFHSRPISDMAERSHSMHLLRLLPGVVGDVVVMTGHIVLIAAGMAWLHQPMAPVAALAALFALAIPIAAHPILAERDMRVRTHIGAMSRFYLDALIGLIAVRTHGAERSLRRAYEGLLVEWARAKLGLLRTEIVRDGVQIVVVVACVIWIILDFLARGGDAGSALLLAYWGLNLPFWGRLLMATAQQYITQRNVMLRVLEPLNAPLDADIATAEHAPYVEPTEQKPERCGVAINMTSVSVRAAGHTILQDISLVITPGEHIAIVGPSGAGKSSLVGLLLGWHRPAGGQICVDEQLLDGAGLERLRQTTAWVDPAIQLWNAGLIDNLLYGAPKDQHGRVGDVIAQADLLSALERLPAGLQTTLGEGGGYLSGGEGQRVRLGRAMLRPDARLVILDEPFRGLDRAQRSRLLDRARRLWRHATLLCITHDVGETRAFDRVLVVDDGQIAEQGTPTELAAQPDSRYNAMLQAEVLVYAELWMSSIWRYLNLESGRLIEPRGKEKER